MPRLVTVFITTIMMLSLALVITPIAAAESDNSTVVARNAIVIDAESGAVLFERAADEQAPPASLTKIFTAIASAEITAPDRPMTTTDADLVGEASMGLVTGETDTFTTLLHGMLLSSGNDAAMTIARNLSATNGDLDNATVDPFVAYTNARIAEIGATNTHLVNPHGLDADGHVTTARDLATITRYGLASVPAFREAIGAISYKGDGHSLHTTNDFAGTYPGLVGGKTGITTNAGYCLIEVAQRDGRTIIAVLLGSTSESWYADARSLLDTGFATPLAPAAQPAQPHQVMSNTSGLAVSGAGAERVVTSGAVAAQKAHAPGVWAMMALVAIPCLLVIATILARVIEPPRRRAARRSHVAIPPRQPVIIPAGMPMDATAPFPIVPTRHIAPPRQPLRPRRVTEPTAVPSFGD